MAIQKDKDKKDGGLVTRTSKETIQGDYCAIFVSPVPTSAGGHTKQLGCCTVWYHATLYNLLPILVCEEEN